ncbi:two-partner secretion domain-containing protein [Burkholderia ubonensis]|uniref:two-partner secretion domain-containing protein n=6 Tax=Burkholderia ubonensis TaxID=101571 RepID=UPI0008480ABF|nr:GLUG motif-containing protein [Burkholderia ubonensis]ODQ34659.1 filamentous hemagglutinin [Burkholderia ubonensis]
MNKTYALVWNQAQHCWKAVGETARRRGKSSGGKRVAAAAVSLLGLAALPAFALPTGEAITTGKADIVRTDDGRTMNINQHTDKLVTNWQDFSVGGGERVSFHQPGSRSIALNRVIGNNGSHIDGQIDANGKVFLVNPNGVLFGAGAQINVGGLVASTQNLTDADFLAGNYRFAGTSAASIVNDGTITAADGGSVALLGARVSNNGVIQAKLGRVALGAGNTFNVNFDGNGLLNLQVEGGAVDAQAHNGGLLKADGGDVLMTARAAGNLLGAVVNNTGTIEAKGLASRGGKITLDGGTVKVAGKLDASAAEAGAPAGTVVTRGERVDVAHDVQVDTRAGNAAGKWTIEAANAGVNGTDAAGRSIDADTLSRNLGTTNVELVNTQGDLTVGGPVSWTSDNALTLTSRKGNVDLQKTLQATGANASLVVNAADKIRVSDAIKLTGDNAHLELNSANGHTLANDKAVVTLSGKNASYRSNGEDYTVLHTVADLRNVDANLNGRYVLGNALDGNGANFRSIGGEHTFTGKFDGFGNTIRRLSVYNTGPVGLFASNSGAIGNLVLESISASGASSTDPLVAVGSLVGVNRQGTISNVRVANATVSHAGARFSRLGGIVGVNEGGVIDRASFSGRLIGNQKTDAIGGIAGVSLNGRTTARIANSTANVDITAVGTDGLSAYGVGGLVGALQGGVVEHSSSSGRIAGGRNNFVGGAVGLNLVGQLDGVTSTVDVSAGAGSVVGGLVGRNAAGTISRSAAYGRVDATGARSVGGLVGTNDLGARIVDSHAYGDVDGRDSAAIGGLAGINDATIDKSTASGRVSATTGRSVGGLVGDNQSNGVITASSAGGNVSASGPATVGGLAGRNAGRIDGGKASGMVTVASNSVAGGLVGSNSGKISEAEATGNVVAQRSSRVGGLVGENSGTVVASRASGRVSAEDQSIIGGLVGANRNGGTVKDSVASGDVTGSAFQAGGLVGSNDAGALIASSSSSGRISGSPFMVGGLVGFNSGKILNSSSSSTLAFSPIGTVGTLVGLNTGVVESSSASGSTPGVREIGINAGKVIR